VTLAELYRTDAARLRRVVGSKLTGDSDLADDACAFAWMQAVEHWPIEPYPFGWLVTTAEREAWAMQRKRRGRRDPASVPEPVDPRSEAQERLEAREAVATLSRNQRTALTARVIGLSYAETGAATGRTYTWTNRHVSEGRKRLREAVAA
jgi:DNA-directed RNA polymerase specialized sigma24 family protein